MVMRLGERMFHHLASGARGWGPAKGRTVLTWTVPPKMPRAFPSGNARATPALPPKRLVKGDSPVVWFCVGSLMARAETVEQGRPWQPHSPISL